MPVMFSDFFAHDASSVPPLAGPIPVTAALSARTLVVVK